MALVWTEERHGTGFPEIDAQHQNLMKRFNALNEVLDGGPGNKSRACELIHFFEDYIEEHFKAEEELMERTQCASGLRNKEEHDAFVKEFRELRMRLEREGLTEELVRTVHDRVMAEIDTHFALVDTGLRTVAK